MFERRNDKPGRGRLRTALAVVAVTAVVASMAVVGTVAAQTGQRFPDVPRTHYAYDSVEWAVVNGITQGCGDGRNFCPDNTLNRAQMVTFLKRYHDKFHGTAAGNGDNGDNGDDPEEWVIDGYGTTGRLSTDSITLSAGQYLANFELRFRHAADDDIMEIEVQVGGPETVSNRQLFPKLVAADAAPSGNLLIFRGRGSFEVSTRGGLSRLPEGRIYFTVTVKGKDDTVRIAAAQWEIVVTER